MKSITSLALVAIAVASVNGHAFPASALMRRGPDDTYGGVNITLAAYMIRDSISSPTCSRTGNCTEFVNNVIPRCERLKGSAGCWCTLHDPLHYCAICMSSPTDATTTSDQTQGATTGHTNYHTGCAAYQRYLSDNGASMSASAAAASSTSDDHDDHHGMATGTIVGIAVGGVAFLAIVIAATVLIWRCMKNQSEREARPAATGAGGEKRQDSMPVGDPVRVTSYFGNTDLSGHHPHTPPPPVPYSPQAANYTTAQPYSPALGSAVPLLEGMAARPDSMYTTAQSSSYNPAMRATSEFGGSSQGGSQQVYQPSQYHVSNDVAPPPFSPHPQGYDTSLLVGVPAAPAGNEKARYQGSPQP
ncbi:hypothetical protein FRC01_005464 [Tulasnella sp. 417]|nr:hypothetical protein FRC01_005464 [Tulasnella sp. 417]